VDINSDPNNPTTPSLPLLLPATQISMAGGLDDLNSGTSVLVQQLFSGNISRNYQDGSTYQGSWNALYTQALADLEVIIREGTAQQQWGYVAIAKLQKAYIYSIMVDMWGDVPYLEASQGEANVNAAFDHGADVYESLFALIDEALADINTGTYASPGTADIIYSGKQELWIRFGNTLKLKLYNQIRLVDEPRATQAITDLLSSGGLLIADNAQDFSFRFGSSPTPENQHPWYNSEYQGGKSYYMSQGFMDMLFKSDDPRIRYYFYRQLSNASVNNGRTGNGYGGRYTGDATANPNDNATKATVGIYPAGGLYDDNPINNLTAEHEFISNAGANTDFLVRVVSVNVGTGAGILPFLTNAMAKFIQAEAALTLGTPGDATLLLGEAVKAHLHSVNTVVSTGGNSAALMSEATIDAFVQQLVDEFEAADESGKLNLLLTQKYIAQYGNGIESYNDYRRTGLPQLPEPLAPLNTFPLRLTYSQTELATNTAVSGDAGTLQTSQQITPVFWDVK